ncbi:hypothetical protein [Dyadobacter sp. NIV53]|uniref:hypothetical protein n=1 Tax=Dyadobacter sp. NIV53 TaxID=2861765 RepID=UPI001E2A868E|nr:hypothetical protein [Dyadobacter sp. NIV53]
MIPLLAIVFLLQSCNNDSTEPINVYDYYPLEIGKYQIYSVKVEVYSAGVSAPVTTTYQEKDEIESMSTDAQGISTYIFSRSTRNTSTDYWQKTKNYSVTEYPDKLLTNIDNQTFFSLIFPIDLKVTWNGNIYNNLDSENYHYEDINKPMQIDTLRFDNTLTLVERKDTSIINRYTGTKIYGLGVGLISDDQIAYEYCQADDCIGSETIESGTHKTRTIISYGTR